jgi:hypothetical protein
MATNFLSLTAMGFIPARNGLNPPAADQLILNLAANIFRLVCRFLNPIEFDRLINFCPAWWDNYIVRTKSYIFAD